ncbi:WAT1-related protein At4g08290-like [Gastrolobium bilobum]|uniref:WAT1-related protein At4g08290-like n=1 Tax=Gastrolobium bilobum TaxID=150636 RepID=UPI002AB2EB91|nr:WAT1-related protein At4g08290-like [Gastrolobium bilobum]
MEKICGASFGKMCNQAKPYLLTVGLQFGMAGTYIFTKASLNHGMSRLVFIVYRNAIAAFALAPFALIFERKTRPKMTISVFIQILALGFLEPVIDQGFTFLGMQYTSASFASAVMNAVPSVTFVLAVILRLERVKIKELRSQAKVIGTLVSFGGALLMTLYKGPQMHLFHHSNTTHQQDGSLSPQSHTNWVKGTLFICLGCVAWSSFYILQSITVRKYPAELSLSSLICLMGALQSAVVALVADHNSRAWAIGLDYRLYGPLYTGIMSSGIAYYIQGLVMQSRGPVFVTSFNPLCMIIVAALSSFLLGEHIYLGSIVGGIIIAVGLYSVVWGKGKDDAELTPPLATTNKTETQQLPITSATNK